MITVQTGQQFPSARGFYERLGFVRDGAEKVAPLMMKGGDIEVTDVRYTKKTNR